MNKDNGENKGYIYLGFPVLNMNQCNHWQCIIIAECVKKTVIYGSQKVGDI